MRFPRETGEQRLLKEIKRCDKFNKDALEKYYSWKTWFYSMDAKTRTSHKYCGTRRLKPYKLDPVLSLRSQILEDDVLYKYQQLIFGRNYRLEAMLFRQEIPFDIIERYIKRYKKDEKLRDALVYQYSHYDSIPEDFIIKHATAEYLAHVKEKEVKFDRKKVWKYRKYLCSDSDNLVRTLFDHDIPWSISKVYIDKFQRAKYTPKYMNFAIMVQFVDHGNIPSEEYLLDNLQYVIEYIRSYIDEDTIPQEFWDIEGYESFKLGLRLNF